MGNCASNEQESHVHDSSLSLTSSPTNQQQHENNNNSGQHLSHNAIHPHPVHGGSSNSNTMQQQQQQGSSKRTTGGQQQNIYNVVSSPHAHTQQHDNSSGTYGQHHSASSAANAIHHDVIQPMIQQNTQPYDNHHHNNNSSSTSSSHPQLQLVIPVSPTSNQSTASYHTTTAAGQSQSPQSGKQHPSHQQVDYPVTQHQQHTAQRSPRSPGNGSSSSNLPILKNRYELQPGILGKGHFAKVKKCYDLQTRQYLAIKIIDKKELVKSSAIVKAEIEILKQVGEHRHVVALIDWFEDQKEFYLVMQYWYVYMQ